MWPKSIYNNVTLLLLLTFSQSALATLSLQELQPIANFPSSCQAAYVTPIQGCPDASSFTISVTKSSPSICSSDCISALDRATQAIQKACVGTSAPPGTVIAHAFIGDLTVWLCTVGVGGTSPSASNSNPSNTAQSPSGTAKTTKSTLDPTNTGATRTQTSASDSSSAIPTNSQTKSTFSTSASSSSPTASQTPSQSISPSSQTTAAPFPSSSSQSGPTLKPGGGGSPFDQTVPNAAPTMDASQNMLSLVVGVAFAVAFGN